MFDVVTFFYTHNDSLSLARSLAHTRTHTHTHTHTHGHTHPSTLQVDDHCLIGADIDGRESFGEKKSFFYPLSLLLSLSSLTSLSSLSSLSLSSMFLPS